MTFSQLAEAQHAGCLEWGTPEMATHPYDDDLFLKPSSVPCQAWVRRLPYV